MLIKNPSARSTLTLMTRRWHFAALPICLSTLVACALPTPTNSTADERKQGSAKQLATMQTYQYIRIDADKTGIVNAADDGKYTYIAFNQPVPAGATFFTSEGRGLTSGQQNNIVALSGVYPGVLVRVGQSNSYIAPNPRASSADQPNLESDPDLVEARNRLEVRTTQLPAFNLAIQRADQTLQGQIARIPPEPAAPRAQGNSPLRPAATPNQSGATQAATTYAPPQVSSWKSMPSDDPTYQKVSDGVMIRVFFSSGGRAIVRPDDGLQRLEAEAMNADEIRISGFTDANGPESFNTFLARSRAEAVRTILVNRGIPPNKILVNWTHTGRYIGNNTTAEGRALNRRVEVVLVKTGLSAVSTR